ncbi:MAG: hypothetical protein ACRC92_20180 [Peptostreptococcaceae bacterium]
MDNRIMLSKSSVYININSKSNIDLSMMDTKNNIKLSAIKNEIEMIKSRNFPAVPLIVGALESGKIVLTTSSKPGSSIQIIAAVTDNGRIDKVFVNVSAIAKMTKSVNPGSGEIEDVMTVSNYEELYDVLLGGYAALQTERIMENFMCSRELADKYTDLIAEVISRAFGNPIDGEKFRFITKQFFYNGTVGYTELSNIEKYSLDAAGVLGAKYPSFFEKNPKGITLEMYLSVLASEFPTMKDVSLQGFIAEAIKAFGSNAVYMVDNYPYLIAVFVNRSRKNKKVFNGYKLRSLEQGASTLLNNILRCML